MYRIGIDVGSTFTKYCVMEDNKILELWKEKSPIRQSQYFDKRINELEDKFGKSKIVSCGYGRKNVASIKQINEMSALAKGVSYIGQNSGTVLDIGGQDIKLIRHEQGKLKEFFVNDKCAAGSGAFLINSCNMLDMDLSDITLISDNNIKLTSTCAVFAQSEIVELIADNVPENVIVSSVIEHILLQAKKMLGKMVLDKIVLSGGMTCINEFDTFASQVLGVDCIVCEYGEYYSAIGCAVDGQ